MSPRGRDLPGHPRQSADQPVGHPVAHRNRPAVGEVAADDEVRVLVVDSADPEIFIAHADVALIQDLPTDDLALHDELSFFHTLTERVRTLPKATIAVIEGVCRGGGCELAMAFDMRYAATGTDGVRAIRRCRSGIIPGGGATQRLPRLVGAVPGARGDLGRHGRRRRNRRGLGIRRPGAAARPAETGSSTGSPGASHRARRRPSPQRNRP